MQVAAVAEEDLATPILIKTSTKASPRIKAVINKATSIKVGGASLNGEWRSPPITINEGGRGRRAAVRETNA
ncbi:hypothetical protein A2U01_0069094, partial [Trifolium medium]|nr:hypothetical protein [Trifolium medium]